MKFFTYLIQTSSFVWVLGYVFIILTVAQAGASSSCLMSLPGNFVLGFTLTHITVHASEAAFCMHSHAASLRGIDNIVGHYDKSSVRRLVRADLNEMSAAGARAARVILWYRHSEDHLMTVTAARNNALGYLVASNGRLPQIDLDNLHNFAQDLVAAGYLRLYVNIASMGASNPRTSARNCEPGIRNCYNPKLLLNNWSVAEQIISSFRSTPVTGLDVVFDLASESCFVAPARTELDKNLESEIRYMISHFAARFGSGGFVISCSGANKRRAVAGLSALRTVFIEMGVQPAAIDLHVYDVDPSEAADILQAGNDTARSLGVPFDIAETFAYNATIMSTISRLSEAGRLNSLRTLMMFPRTSDSACDVNVALPYDISRLKQLLEQRGKC